MKKPKRKSVGFTLAEIRRQAMHIQKNRDRWLRTTGYHARKLATVEQIALLDEMKVQSHRLTVMLDTRIREIMGY